MIVRNPLPGGQCLACGDPHPALDELRVAQMIALGLSEREIHLMLTENALAYSPGAKPPAPSADAERMRRYRARKKAKDAGDPTPKWASRRQKRGS